MPDCPLGELIAQAVYSGLHPLSSLAYRLLGVRAPGDLDLAVWALLTWLLGSRESEALKKLGFIAAAGLALVALLEAVLTNISSQ